MAERRAATTTTTERRSVIITFKRKDQRPDRTTDKVDIVRSALTQGVQPHFLDAMTLPMGAARPPLEPHLVGYDVNQYEVPIVTAQLTEGEINALRQNDNVAMVEDDAPCYALEGVVRPPGRRKPAVPTRGNHSYRRPASERPAGLGLFARQGDPRRRRRHRHRLQAPGPPAELRRRRELRPGSRHAHG